MSLRLLFIFVILSFQIIIAQVVTIEPQFATQNDSITITVDIKNATRKDLIGYTGELYTHTGVTTNKGTWQHVIGTWRNNSQQPKLTRIGTDMYQLTIGSPRVFYKITDTGENITQLDFVFRSADGTKQTEDILVDIYEAGLNLSIISPANNLTFINLNKTLNIIAVGSNTLDMALYIQDTLVTSVLNDTLIYNFSANSSGKKKVKVVANGELLTVADSFYVIVNANALVQELPEGVEDGINYIDDNTVTLSIYAPHKKFIYLIGDFNNWQIDPEYFLNVTPDSNHFWITLDSLTSKQEYAFQYLIDGDIRVADPYSEKILDPWNDESISPTTYPGLKPYPEGKTENIVGVFQPGQDEFNWQVSEFHKPARTDLVIYELLVRDFVARHDYKTLIDTLSYLKRLGVNAIELMPICEFEGNESWGYNPMMYFAPDKYYGPREDLKAFIDAAHQNGIAVINDIVLNHAYGLNPLVRMYFEGGKPAANNPWFNQQSPNPVYSWGYDFNHESTATKYFVDRITSYWLTEYKFDGFRFDFTKGFTNKAGDGWVKDDSRIAILERMADKIWEVDSTAYVIFEHLTENSEEKILADFGIMLWGNMNYNYNEATMGWNNNSDFSWGIYKSRNWSYPNLVTYMESHDEERLMFKNIQYGNASGNYKIKDTSQALNRIKLATAFFLTIPGPKMIWQFGELGYDYSIDYNGRVGNKPIRWDYQKQERREKLYKVYQALIKLRLENEAFRSADFSTSLAGALKSIHIKDQSMNVAIIGNFDVVSGSINPQFQGTGKWYDYFTGDSIEVSNVNQSINLQPGEFHIYTTKKLPAPEADILTEVDEPDQLIPNKYSLEQNFPNPFNPSTNIGFTIPEAGLVKLVIYDILGREVQTIVNEQKNPGVYQVNWNASNFSSGIYIYKIWYNGNSISRKMLLMK